MTNVAILIPSFRPELFFEKLLPEIEKQISDLAKSDFYMFEIFALIPQHFNLELFTPNVSEVPLHILRTAESGFSTPRNILWNSAHLFDINIFLDDDQIPQSKWLRELLNGIETHPSYSVYFGDIHFKIPDNSPNKAFSKLLPKNRLGIGRELLTINHGIANTAFSRKGIPRLIDPFRLDFNKGGEDISFFESLRGLGCRFYELSGCAVTEEWEISRLQASVLLSRTKRGIYAYYKLRLEQIPSNWSECIEFFRIYSRIFFTLPISPLLTILLILNIFNPKDVLRIQIRCFVMKIFYVSMFPWRLKIETIFKGINS